MVWCLWFGVCGLVLVVRSWRLGVGCLKLVVRKGWSGDCFFLCWWFDAGYWMLVIRFWWFVVGGLVLVVWCRWFGVGGLVLVV